MQTNTFNRFIEKPETTDGSPKPAPHLRFLESRTCRRAPRAGLALRRREECRTRRAMLAALREAEFAEWMNSGGDFLDSRPRINGGTDRQTER